MNLSHFCLSEQNLRILAEKPEEVVFSKFLDVPFHAKLIIPHFHANTQTHYQEWVDQEVNEVIHSQKLPKSFEHLGIHISFDQPTEIHLYDEAMQMRGNLHKLIEQFGMIVFKNGHLCEEHRNQGHRNRFPHLHFHRDRNENQPTPYSLFCRDPFDEEQREPRLSSTLFTTYLVAHLQARKEEQTTVMEQMGTSSHYDLFKDEEKEGKVRPLFGQIIHEHPWNEPTGVGEITIMDNRTLLHASYYRHFEKGYRIGVRYLK